MKWIHLSILPVFLVLSMTFTQVNATGNDMEQTYHELVMLPLDDSPYKVEFVAVTKNQQDGLVSVINGDVYAYLPHPILDNHLNKFPSDYITKDGINYKKWSVWSHKIHQNEKPIHGTEVQADFDENNKIVIFRILHASIVVEKNDVTDYFITVHKRLN